MRVIPDPPWSKLGGALSTCDDLLGRLDERLKNSPVAAGLRARTDLAETCAIALSDGDLIDPHDLLLHDAQMDARSPTHELVRAHRLFLAARRRAGQGDAADHLTRPGLRRLAGLPGRPVQTQADGALGFETTKIRAEIEALLLLADDLSTSPEETADLISADAPADPTPAERGAPTWVDPSDEAGAELTAAFDCWQMLRRESKKLPPALAAILLNQAWIEDPPLPRHAWLAALINGLYLRARGRVSNLLLPVEIGTRVAQRAPTGGQGSFWEQGLVALEAAARDSLARHDRLLLARERLQKLCAGKRGHSHLWIAGELALETPLVTLKTIAAHCAITERAAQGLVEELAGFLVEVSGRQRYRAWTLS
jgi:hypothetical protein